MQRAGQWADGDVALFRVHAAAIFAEQRTAPIEFFRRLKGDAAPCDVGCVLVGIEDDAHAFIVHTNNEQAKEQSRHEPRNPGSRHPRCRPAGANVGQGAPLARPHSFGLGPGNEFAQPGHGAALTNEPDARPGCARAEPEGVMMSEFIERLVEGATVHPREAKKQPSKAKQAIDADPAIAAFREADGELADLLKRRERAQSVVDEARGLLKTIETEKSKTVSNFAAGRSSESALAISRKKVADQETACREEEEILAALDTLISAKKKALCSLEEAAEQAHADHCLKTEQEAIALARAAALPHISKAWHAGQARRHWRTEADFLKSAFESLLNEVTESSPDIKRFAKSENLDSGDRRAPIVRQVATSDPSES
jgi:hypothetical protein